MTYQQIMTRIKELYPHGEQISTIIAHINAGQDDLAHYFGKTIVDSSLSTVVDQDEYAFPAGIEDVSQIKFLDIGNSATPVDRFDYVRYTYIEQEYGRPMGSSFYQVVDSSGDKTLGLYPVPSVASLPIRITYQKKLTEATASTLATEPEFDSRYHDLLVYYACHLICSSGASPDTIQADSFMQKYEEGLEELWRNKMEKTVAAPPKMRDNRTWYR